MNHCHMYSKTKQNKQTNSGWNSSSLSSSSSSSSQGQCLQSYHHGKAIVSSLINLRNNDKQPLPLKASQQSWAMIIPAYRLLSPITTGISLFVSYLLLTVITILLCIVTTAQCQIADKKYIIANTISSYTISRWVLKRSRRTPGNKTEPKYSNIIHVHVSLKYKYYNSWKKLSFYMDLRKLSLQDVSLP